MPLYEYQCDDCGADLEKLAPMPGEEVITCPYCGGKASRRLSPFNSTFGWRLSDESHLPGHKDELVRNV